VAAGHYGIDPSKIFPVHNGADPVEVFHTKKKFPEKLVLFLGRLTAQKGPEFFLEIAAKVLEQTDNVRFVMAGTGEKLRQLIETGAFHGVGDRFHFSRTSWETRCQVRNQLLNTTAEQLTAAADLLDKTLAGGGLCIVGGQAQLDKCEGLEEVITL
jgi:glycosyltransferase involved in cell wall biosynthesis